MSQGERFNKIIEYLGVNQRELARQLSVSQAYISKQVSSSNPLTHGLIEKLLFLEKLNNNVQILNVTWLLTGEGEMFLDKQLESNAKLMGDVSAAPNVTVVPFSVNAGSGIASQLVEVVGKASIPMIRGNAFAFHVKGSSMSPVFETGDWAIAYPLASITDIKDGKCHIIKNTSGEYFLKYISKRGNKIVLISEKHLDHPNIEIPNNEIDRIWSISHRLTEHWGW